MPLSMSLIFGILHPYRTDAYNRLGCAYFGLLAFAQLLGISELYIKNVPIIVFYMLICVPIIFVLLFYIALPIVKFCYSR